MTSWSRSAAASLSFGLCRVLAPTVIQTLVSRCSGCHVKSWVRGFALSAGSVFSHSVCCPGSNKPRHVPLEVRVEKLWREFFSDPSQWWDHRSEKANSKYPDFKHKKTQQSLWLDNKSTPLWVEAELAAIAPGTLQLNIFSWNIRLRRYVKAGNYEKTMDLFKQLHREGMTPDKFTYLAVLNACAGLLALEDGRRIHSQITKSGFERDLFVGNCLVDMYAKCGRIEDARRVFNKMPTRDVVSWNALILGCVECGQGHEGLELFRLMQQEGVDSSPITYVGVLSACASIAALEEGRCAHESIIDRGYECNVYVANSLVDMYAKCGSIEDARRVFNKMQTRDVVSWGALILGYVNCGQGQEALELSEQMRREEVDFDAVTFVGVLNACASTGALDEGRRAHKEIIKSGYESDVYVASSLVDMYAKCGSIEDAQGVFSNRSTRNLVSWNAMLAGLSRNGYVKEPLEHFEQMCEEVGVDAVSFISLLSACSHGGLVDEGMHYFESMSAVFNISPTLEHYACVIDLLSRAGHLHEAEDLITSMPFEPDGTVWMSLLGACRIHNNVEMGECVARKVLVLEPENAAGYLLLSNMHVATGKRGGNPAVGCGRLERVLKETAWRTWIEVNNKVHSFLVNDGKHPQIAEIHAKLEQLSAQM